MPEKPDYQKLPDAIASEHFIRVPLCHQETPYTCGVACVQSLLGCYGIVYKQDILAELLGQRPIYGTDYNNILSFLTRLGFHATFHIEMTLELLMGLIDRGLTPLLLLQAWKDIDIEYSYDWKDSHYAIACGYDTDRIMFMDPWTLGNYTYVPFDILMKRWHAFDFSGKHFYHPGLVISHTQLSFTYNPQILKPMD